MNAFPDMHKSIVTNLRIHFNQIKSEILLKERKVKLRTIGLLILLNKKGIKVGNYAFAHVGIIHSFECQKIIHYVHH